MVEQSLLDPIQEVLLETQSPFPVSVSTTLLPRNFKMSSIRLYDGKTDPIAHVQTYMTWMNITEADAPTLCNAFLFTLYGPA